MDTDKDLWELLVAHDIDYDTPFQSIWVEGLDVEEVARRLGADPNSARACDWREIVTGRYTEHGDGVIWIGPQAPGWVQVIQLDGNDAWQWRSWVELTRDGGRLLYLGWPLYELEGVEDLEYVVAGEVVTTLVVGDPEERDGTDPDALDGYLDGLAFKGDSAAAEVTSALRLIGRVTGRELDEAWLNGPHTRYVIPASAREEGEARGPDV
ncbi:hypothetical protein LDL08_04600 [Nonomuraea glycinis]|uniref:Uncharacterized protein n=1 Tax=Nonomuraea glycinis TaxID=2047744 RepID=A0A918A2C1_9ACTN|nr:hypothetical protein [Nonomuraea glycinis]MCA2175459.1 hypothetical protein [Nonomuraea glycinis]GGP04753.1 hypothetical protein GCM10012278_21240 [Nonomuraea glycinis]